MTVDPSTFVALLSLLIVGPLVWVIKTIIRDIKDLQERQSAHETHVAQNYVQKDDLHRELQDIKDMIGRIFEKLDNAYGKRQ